MAKVTDNTPEVKTNVTNPEEAKKAGFEVFGDPGIWQLLSKASKDNVLKSTKVMNIPAGCLVQVSTMYKSGDGTISVAEALTFVPGCWIDTRGESPAIVSLAQAKLEVQNES